MSIPSAVSTIYRHFGHSIMFIKLKYWLNLTICTLHQMQHFHFTNIERMPQFVDLPNSKNKAKMKSLTYSAGKHTLSLKWQREGTLADKVQKENWHKNMSYQPQCIWRTALNFLVAQTPQCEWCKSRGLCPSCLLYEDKTCIFRTLLFLWKGHRLVWNIKQLMLSEIKRILEECGKLQKGFDGIYIYIAQSPADMTEWRNKDTGTKSFWGRKDGRGYSSLWILHIIIPHSENLALKMSRLLTEKADEGDVWERWAL